MVDQLSEGSGGNKNEENKEEEAGHMISDLYAIRVRAALRNPHRDLWFNPIACGRYRRSGPLSANRRERDNRLRALRPRRVGRPTAWSPGQGVWFMVGGSGFRGFRQRRGGLGETSEFPTTAEFPIEFLPIKVPWARPSSFGFRVSGAGFKVQCFCFRM